MSQNKGSTYWAIHPGTKRWNWRVKPTKYSCPNPNCQSVFVWKRNLTSHLRYQCGQQPRFKCPYCDYMCKVKADIRKHIRVKHQDHDIYVIDIFQQWNKFQRSNDDDRIRFSCPNYNCSRAFSWKRNLTRHLKYECGLQPRFKCPYCDYYSKLKGNLKKHLIRRHKNRKAYVVDLIQGTS
ncbi:Zinc finger protein 64-like protein, isoforms 1 and 2 [Harpegnathos saltator]|uniref:Zinc finger protein 64-like protein, isoforms 1 and 2 n=1 Tax=Harpegnathos saltator TaxID=610380 RepID=E2BJA7_HARSA|nr:Zinc finger protein 64-like protein, isoforms 1 and 2 [Harpegnathos saltator]